MDNEAKAKAEARRQRILASGEKRIKYIYGEEKTPELSQEEKLAMETKRIEKERIEKENLRKGENSFPSTGNGQATLSKDPSGWIRKGILVTIAVCAVGSPLTHFTGFLITLVLLSLFLFVEYLSIFTLNGIQFSAQTGLLTLFNLRSTIGNEFLLFVGTFIVGYFAKQAGSFPT